MTDANQTARPWRRLVDAPKDRLIWIADSAGTDIVLGLWCDVGNGWSFHDRHGCDIAIDSDHWMEFASISPRPDLLNDLAEMDPGSSSHFNAAVAFARAARLMLQRPKDVTDAG